MPSPTSRRRKPVAPAAAPVPNLHFWLIVFTVGLIVVCLMMYAFVPESRASLYDKVILFLLGLLGGKLTNSYGRPMTALKPTVEAIPDDLDGDGIPDEADKE